MIRELSQLVTHSCPYICTLIYRKNVFDLQVDDGELVLGVISEGPEFLATNHTLYVGGIPGMVDPNCKSDNRVTRLNEYKAKNRF